MSYLAIVNLYLKNEVFLSTVTPDFLDTFITDKSKAERILTNFGCKDFSWAIHNLTGWEVWEYGDDENDDSHWFHSVCKIPNSNLIIDGKGIRTECEMLRDYASPSYVVDVDPEPLILGSAELETLKLFGEFLLKRDYILIPHK